MGSGHPFPVGQLRRPWPEHIGESAGVTTRFEVNNSLLLPVQDAHVSSSARTADAATADGDHGRDAAYPHQSAVIMCAIEAGVRDIKVTFPAFKTVGGRDGVR
jgi:hypothetical protein